MCGCKLDVGNVWVQVRRRETHDILNGERRKRGERKKRKEKKFKCFSFKILPALIHSESSSTLLAYDVLFGCIFTGEFTIFFFECF